MVEKILVLGATGMLGEPAARQLQADGFQVRILARDVAIAEQLFGPAYEIVAGDVSDLASLEEAMQGCDGVHISVGGAVDQLSAENVARLAPKLGVEHITYLSGSTVAEQNAWYSMTAQKLNAEKALTECGVTTTILRPTWPMEQLPRFVVGGRATVIGVLTEPWHWFAARDLARMLSNAYQNEQAWGKRLYIHGPQGISLKEALERYCQALHPEIEEVAVMPIEAARAMAASTGNTMLKNVTEMMAYFQQVGEPGDPAEANRWLGAPAITLEAWIEGRK
jgi:uncharacterized protein YbjT (DUF2867 family)